MARPPRSIDISGQTFGHLTVIERIPSPGTGRAFWRCRCVCGNERITRGDRLRHGRAQSCGCKGIPDLTGQTFGRWTVIERAATGKGDYFWRCRCECGTERNVVGWALRKGSTLSCGCRRAEITAKVKTTHGATRSTKHLPEYALWQAMLQRCNNPNNGSFDSYGGRGIKVCGRWQRFENFFADMGPRPPGTSLDRIDNEKGYGPDNCRWATTEAQNRNKRSNRLVVYQGERMTLADAAQKSGISYSVIHARIRLGWPEQKWFIPTLH